MPRWIAIASLFFGLFFVTTVSGVVSTERHIRHYFGMPNYVGAVPEHVNAAITRQLPRESSHDKVESFLSDRGIGKDGSSSARLRRIVGSVVVSQLVTIPGNCSAKTTPSHLNLMAVESLGMCPYDQCFQSYSCRLEAR